MKYFSFPEAPKPPFRKQQNYFVLLDWFPILSIIGLDLATLKHMQKKTVKTSNKKQRSQVSLFTFWLKVSVFALL